jgi:hypothetical protein
LRITLALDIPIFNSSDDVSLVSVTKLEFDFVTTFCLRILQQEVEASRSRLNALEISHNQIAETQYRGIVSYEALYPFLCEFRVVLQRKPFMRNHCCPVKLEDIGCK